MAQRKELGTGQAGPGRARRALPVSSDGTVHLDSIAATDYGDPL